jgi:hypothetical protein
VAVQLVWRHPERREAELALYVAFRMVRVPGWRHLLVAMDRRDAAWVGIELAPNARENDARDWAGLFHERYRVEATIEELLADPRRFKELYIDGGVGAFLNEYERWVEAREQERRRLRDERGNR